MRRRTILSILCSLGCLLPTQTPGDDPPPAWNSYRPVRRPPLPDVTKAAWIRNPIDAFVTASHESLSLSPRPEAPKDVLLRRVYLDLIGLSPSPAEQRAFAADNAPDAYERLVDRLLNDPRHGERWARHWMDVWRYSDWAGWSGGAQIRDSKPHIWRWRDWIVESLNHDKGYDRMILEMLAADELAPADPDTLRATGYLVRNFKLLSRERWLEDTVKHTAQAFLGLTIGCAKCHDHRADPIPQTDYFRMRAIFEPHQVRTDRVPGQVDTRQDGLVRAYDADLDAPTYLFLRGDERQPDTNDVIRPGVPEALSDQGTLVLQAVSLPKAATVPDKRPFVIKDLTAAAQQAVIDAQQALEHLESAASPDPGQVQSKRLEYAIAKAKHASLLAVLRVEALDDQGKRNSEAWQSAATEAGASQRQLAVLEAGFTLHQARLALAKAEEKAKPDADKKLAEAEKALTEAERKADADPTPDFQPRSIQTFPETSTGRRLSFARWIADPNNPRTARVAVNHIWLRHFGRGIVSTPADFGGNAAAPSHPELLDWLAAEFTASGWSMKSLHRLIVTSSTYRMASTPDPANAAIDPDNVYLWRMPSRRMEAEIIRDNVLYTATDLDPALGGPEIDHQLGLKSRRRSLYLQVAAEKEVEFLKLFDGPNVTECYQRHHSVMPQQALALVNSELLIQESRRLARTLSAQVGADDGRFTSEAFARILARQPKPDETRLCLEFLDQPVDSATPLPGSASPPASERARQNLILVLFNHNDFVTVR